MKSYTSSGILDEIRHQKLESVASATMVLVGVALPLVDPSNRMLLLASSALTTLGGAMFSTVLASSRERHRAEFEREIDPMLDSISRTLGEAVQQLNALVLETNEEIIDAEAAMARVSVVLPTLRGAITDVLRVGSKSLDLSGYLKTKEELKTLSDAARELQSELTGSEVDRAKVTQLAQQIGQQASNIALKGDVAGEGTQSEMVRCPSCSGELTVHLGVHPGATMMPSCRTCGTRFYVHRGRDGGFFTRLPPPQLARSMAPQLQGRAFEVVCPNISCNKIIPINIPENTGSVTRFCVYCGHRVTVDPSGQITGHDTRPLVRSTEIIGMNVGTAYCPEHNFMAKTFTRLENRIFAVCVPGDHLVYRILGSMHAANSAMNSSNFPPIAISSGTSESSETGVPAVRSESLPITCPNPDCGNSFTFRRLPDGAAQKRWCVKCGMEFSVSSDAKVKPMGVRHAIQASSKRNDEFGRSFLICPQDQLESQTFLKSDEVSYAICSKCSQPLVFHDGRETLSGG